MREVPVIEGFDIVGLLGSGGMATVWKARQHSLDRMVAIKVLNKHLALREEELEQFRAEVRLAARLSHPEIVRVYDASLTAGECHVVMELVDGYTTGQWLRRKGRLGVEDALTVGLVVANALGYAWAHHRMIHCDIKPDNIMVHCDGSVKVTDLGLARTFSAAREQGGEECETEVVGTPAYMSPEQVQGREDLDWRTDIYSLGATLYHLLTGRLIFEDTADQTLLHQLNDHCAPFDHTLELDGASLRGVELLLGKMLAKDRELRYDDWHSVAIDMHRVLKGDLPSPPYLAAPDTTLGYSPETAFFLDHPPPAPPPSGFLKRILGKISSKGA
ncbi:MAG: serine/threonine protein kinase [Kiritimatiellaeota bacterium]|nr:serine/threonine protein kinase [Kiritimatiellota bacterium]